MAPLMYIVRMDIATEMAEEANRWMNERHMSDLLAAGFYSAVRFRSLVGTPQYMNVYEIPDLDVFAAEAYLEVARKDPDRLKYVRAFSNHTNTPYEVALARNTPPPPTAPPGPGGSPIGSVRSTCVVAVASDVATGAEPEFLRWHEDEHMPLILAIPGFQSARLLRRKGVHPRDPHNREPGYLSLWEVENPRILKDNPALERARATPWAEKIRRSASDSSINVMLRIFP